MYLHYFFMSVFAICSLTYQNGLYDLAWSEFDDQIIVTVSNDGHVQIWNISLQQMVCHFYLLQHDILNRRKILNIICIISIKSHDTNVFVELS